MSKKNALTCCKKADSQDMRWIGEGLVIAIVDLSRLWKRPHSAASPALQNTGRDCVVWPLEVVRTPFARYEYAERRCGTERIAELKPPEGTLFNKT